VAGRGSASRGRKPAGASTAAPRRPAAANRPRPPAEPTADQLDERVIDAVLALTARDGWRAASLPAIAAEAGVGLGALYDRFPDKPAILAALIRRVDRAMLTSGGDGPAEGNGPAEGSPRDRLFDVVMRRFETLQTMRPSITAIVAGVDPASAARALSAGVRSLAWMLEAAGLDSTGVIGRLRVAGLATVYARAFRAWLDDDGADLGKTMAALDRGLAQAERWASALPASRRP
jgi:AcrR family transcriptional regulator